MSIVFSDVRKHTSVEKEPYSIFAKKYRALKGDIDSSKIELSIGSGKDGFCKGFYKDEDYMVNPKIKFVFGSNICNSDGSKGSFVRMVYAFECNDCNFEYYRRHITSLKSRAPYLYISGATHFEITSHLDEQFELIFDVIVPDKNRVEAVCYSLLGMIIAIFAFED